jgi:two-component system, cell cycle response regulator CpdR
VEPQATEQFTLRNEAFGLAPAAMSLLRLDGTLLDANDAYLALMGLERDTMGSTTAVDLTHPDDRERTAAYLQQLTNGDIDEVVTEKRYQRADGTTFEARLIARPLRDQNGRTTAILGMIHDLTEQDVFDRVQRELAATQAVAQVAAQSAHELNNLLGAMVLQLDLAEESAATVSLRFLLERATSLGADLLRLTEDDLATTTADPSQPGDEVGERTAVLVVDDEPTLLDTVALALRRSGYEVLAAANGTEALQIATTEHFGLLVTDLVMPDIDGVSLAQQLQQMHPGLPVLFITGYAGGDLIERLPADANVLRKPFRALDLVTSVARLSSHIS